MPNLAVAVEKMRVACEVWSLGYDQYNRQDIRDGGECDCSSLVIWALKQGGFDTGDASYTGNMSYNLTRRGWKRLSADISTCKAGDILLNDTHHVCMVISGKGWNARIAQASIDERGRATGGQAGDQTGNETNVRAVYEYRYGWNCILRYTGAQTGSQTVSDTLDVDGVLGRLSVYKWQTALGTPRDGVVSGQVLANRKYFSALVSVTFETDGSSLVQAAQKTLIKAGFSCGKSGADGILGQATVKALQKWLIKQGYSVGKDGADGYLGVSTAKALQKSLNAGKWS